MYVNVRQHTTMYNMLRQHIRQCTTMFAKKYFPTTEFLSHPKVLHVKLFLKIRSTAYENLRLTANNHDTSRQHSNNYDFLIRTLSHLKIRMWESSIRTSSFSVIGSSGLLKCHFRHVIFFLQPNEGLLTCSIA